MKEIYETAKIIKKKKTIVQKINKAKHYKILALFLKIKDYHSMPNAVSNLFKALKSSCVFCSTSIISKLKVQGLLRQSMHIIYLKDNCCR